MQNQAHCPNAYAENGKFILTVSSKNSHIMNNDPCLLKDQTVDSHFHSIYFGVFRDQWLLEAVVGMALLDPFPVKQEES